MSSSNVQTRQDLLREMQRIAEAIEADQDARVAKVRADLELIKKDVAVLAGEGMGIRLIAKVMVEARKQKAAPEGTQARNKMPIRYRSTVSEATWSGFGPHPRWFDEGNFVEISERVAAE